MLDRVIRNSGRRTTNKKLRCHREKPRDAQYYVEMSLRLKQLKLRSFHIMNVYILFCRLPIKRYSFFSYLTMNEQMSKVTKISF